MVKLWTRASDMAGAPSVYGGSVLVGRAETEVGRGIRAIADHVLRLHVREQTGLMPQTHRKHLRWPGDGQSPKCRFGRSNNGELTRLTPVSRVHCRCANEPVYIFAMWVVAAAKP